MLFSGTLNNRTTNTARRQQSTGPNSAGIEFPFIFKTIKIKLSVLFILCFLLAIFKLCYSIQNSISGIFFVWVSRNRFFFFFVKHIEVDRSACNRPFCLLHAMLHKYIKDKIHLWYTFWTLATLKETMLSLNQMYQNTFVKAM